MKLYLIGLCCIIIFIYALGSPTPELVSKSKLPTPFTPPGKHLSNLSSSLTCQTLLVEEDSGDACIVIDIVAPL